MEKKKAQNPMGPHTMAMIITKCHTENDHIVKHRHHGTPGMARTLKTFEHCWTLSITNTLSTRITR